MFQVPVIEWWARKVLPLTVLMSRKVFGPDHCNVHVCKMTISSKNSLLAADERLLAAYEKLDVSVQEAGAAVSEPARSGALLRQTWWQMLALLGDAALIPARAERVCAAQDADSALQQHVQDQAALSFFLAVQVFARVVDLLCGEARVSLDLHETDELTAQWQDAQQHLQEEWYKTHQNVSGSDHCVGF